MRDDFPAIGNFVKVVSGPGLGAKGRVHGVRTEGPGSFGVVRFVLDVHVASGGMWSFYADDCKVLRKEDRA